MDLLYRKNRTLTLQTSQGIIRALWLYLRTPMQSTQQQHGQNNSWWMDSLLLIVILGGLFFILLGVKPLFVPDEGRYAEIAREMVHSGNYLTPYLNGIKYFEKPVLFYWLEAAAIKAAGLQLWSLRSINALLGLIGCLLTYATVRKLYDRTTGLLAAFILGTSLLYFVMVHMISLDLPVTVFLTASLYAFLLGSQQGPGRARRLYFWGAAATAALAVLTKGLIGIVFPLMIIGCWIVVAHEWRQLKYLYLPSCLLVFLLIAAPWHVLVSLHNPEFFYFYFIEQHFLRYTLPEIGHYQPAWFFIPYLLLGFFPWVVFLPQALITPFLRAHKESGDYEKSLFFILWAVSIFVFFSFSKSKLIPYILPVIPPLAVLTARYLRQALGSQDLLSTRISIRMSYLALLLLATAMSSLLFVFIKRFPTLDPFTADILLDLAACLLLIGTVMGCIYALRYLCKALAVTIMTSCLLLLLILAAVPAIDTRSIRPLANQLNTLIQPQDEVITFNQYYQDLPFYLGRKVSILNWRNELSYGMQHQPSHAWMLDDATFWQHWHSNKRVFVVISLDEYGQLQRKHPQESFYLLGKTLTNALIANHFPS